MLKLHDFCNRAARSTIQTVADINTITPGFRAGAEGGKENASISLRGIGQVPLGEASFRHCPACAATDCRRSEEHTSELQSLMRISYAVFCLKTKKTKPIIQTTNTISIDKQQI